MANLLYDYENWTPDYYVPAGGYYEVGVTGLSTLTYGFRGNVPDSLNFSFSMTGVTGASVRVTQGGVSIFYQRYETVDGDVNIEVPMQYNEFVDIQIDKEFGPNGTVYLTPFDPPQEAPVVGNVFVTVSKNSIDNEVIPAVLSGDFSVVSIYDSPEHGDASAGTDRFYYSPYNNFTGTDSFTYTVAESEGPQSNIGTVYIEVVDNVTSSSDSLPEFLVYELDKGWSFDGNYIPHFVELNWYFGENPFDNKTTQKVRIHGLTKGYTQLSMAVASMHTEYDRDFTEPQDVDLPLNPVHVSSEFMPVTNYVNSSNNGLSLQMRFEGRNTDISKPEPAHVIQVLAIQTSPQGNGNRSN